MTSTVAPTTFTLKTELSGIFLMFELRVGIDGMPIFVTKAKEEGSNVSSPTQIPKVKSHCASLPCVIDFKQRYHRISPNSMAYLAHIWHNIPRNLKKAKGFGKMLVPTRGVGYYYIGFALAQNTTS